MYPCFAAWQQVSLVHKDGSERGEEEKGRRGGGGQETGSDHEGSWVAKSGLERVPLGDVGTWSSEHVFPVLHLGWTTLP